MLPKPDLESPGIKSIPWVCMAFFIAYLVVFLTYQSNEQQRQLELANWYQKSGLFELEWENYISWLRISGEVKQADALEKARANKDTLTVFRAMAFDPSFERENRLRGDQYWNGQQVLQWEQMRAEFHQRAAKLPSVRFGLNPHAPRPSTYLTWHFLQNSFWQWLVALLLVVPFAWAVEGTVGVQRMPILWLGSGIIAGLSYVALVNWSYQPMIGATPMASAVIGMYLGLFALKKVPFLYFHPKNKAWQTINLPGAIPAALWPILPVYEYFGGSPAPHVWVAQVAGLLAGAGLVQLALKTDVAGAEEENTESEEESSARMLRQHLTSGWSSISALSFAEAEEQFNKALALNPGNFNALSGLYQIHKLHPETEKFRNTALQALGATTDSDGEVLQQMTILRDYMRHQNEDEHLPEAIEIRLLMGFTRLEQFKDAEKVASRLLQSKSQDPMLHKAIIRLSQAFQQAHNSTKAAHYAAQAENLAARQQRQSGA